MHLEGLHLVCQIPLGSEAASETLHFLGCHSGMLPGQSSHLEPDASSSFLYLIPARTRR